MRSSPPALPLAMAPGSRLNSTFTASEERYGSFYIPRCRKTSRAEGAAAPVHRPDRVCGETIPKRRAKHVTIFKLPRRLTVGAEESGSPIWVFNGIVIYAEVLQNTVRHQRLLAAEIAIRPRSGFLINL